LEEGKRNDRIVLQPEEEYEGNGKETSVENVVDGEDVSQ